MKLNPDHTSAAPDGRGAEAQPQWRKDFPIDWPQDEFVARRDFTKFMVLTSLAFFVGQSWIAVENFRRRRAGRLPVLKIAEAAAVKVGGSVPFNYPEPHDSCLLVRTSETAFVAFSQKCTHLSCAVKPLPEKGIFHCPCHEGYFDLSSGRPLAGPPRRPLTRIAIEMRGGSIYATGVELRTT